MRSSRLRVTLFTAIGILTGTVAGVAEPPAARSAVARLEADPGKGFSWPYYLYVPQALLAAKGPCTLLVCPNNTGKVDDDNSVHDRAARREVERWRRCADGLGVALLVPAFPRPKADWQIYTHALDRDSLLTRKPGLVRLDRQLVAMMDDAARRVTRDGLSADARALFLGFSASGMFVNRFVFLHPERVKAAAIGSPGGWPLAPVATWKDQKLRYPIGVADWQTVTGASFDLPAVSRVPLFLFLGEKDSNDSVIYRDSYDEEDEKLIMTLFGRTLQERWAVAEVMYRQTLPRSTLRLYAGVGHAMTPSVWSDVNVFFRSHLGRDGALDRNAPIDGHR
jgi:hypothetical protein